MLHPPPARRSADLSVTVKPLPGTVDFLHRPVRPGWHLVVVRAGITFGELARAYTRDLPEWARWRLYTSLEVVDPAVDLSEYHSTRWWAEHWTITRATGAMVSAAGRKAGLLVPLPHIPGQMAS